MDKSPALFVLTIASFALSGCYPTFLTSRPEVQIVVTDEAGTPLEGAKVTLGTIERHGLGGRNTLQDFLTDREGEVEIDDEHEWHMQILLPDGDVSYSWSLCVSKPGYEAIPMIWANFDEPVKISMYPSPVNSVCEWPTSDDVPRVKEREARWIEVKGGRWPSTLGTAWILDEKIRTAMEASAREQDIKLHSWSEYRFQYQMGGDDAGRDSHILIHALCRAPTDADLTKAFYSEPDDGSCFFDTKYTRQVWADQPTPSFGPLKIVTDSGPRSE